MAESSPKRIFATAVLVAGAIAALGLWLHLRFSLALGEPTYFKSAYDEDTYLLLWLEGGLFRYRPLSEVAFASLASVVGGRLDAIMIVADLVLPALAAMAAFLLAGELTTRLSGRLSATLLLLFGQELVSTGSTAVWPMSASLTRIRAFAGERWSVLIPPYETIYLGLFRTPEPQISVALLFLALAALVHIARARGGRWAAPTLLAVSGLLGASYVFLGIPMLVFECAAAVVLVALGHRRAAALVATAAALGIAVWVAMMLTTPNTDSLLFHSRLPVITPAVVAGLLGALLFAGLHLRRTWRSPAAWLALGMMAMPAALTNQQLVTGLMVSARDWERYANYPFLVCGAALALTVMREMVMRDMVMCEGRADRATPARGLRRARVVVPILIALLIARAHHRTYQFFLDINATSVAMARALRQADGAFAGTSVVLAEPGLAPLVRVRTGDARPMLLDYTRVFRAPIPRLASDGRQAVPSAHEAAMFEHFKRLGLSPEGLGDLLAQEATARVGYFLGFSFGFVDWWYPASDERAVRPAEVLAAIPAVVARYRAFRVPDQTRLLVTTDPRPSIPGFRIEPVGSGEALGKQVFVFAQTPS